MENGVILKLNIKESELTPILLKIQCGIVIDGRENVVEGFEKFMLDNKDEVYELIELAMEE